jgi:hypothetical protein
MEEPGSSGQMATFFEETGKCLKIAENASESSEKCFGTFVAEKSVAAAAQFSCSGCG